MNTKILEKTIRVGALAVAIASGISIAATAASAQTYTTYGNTATTTTTSNGSAPVLYNQQGQMVSGYNSSTGALNAGWYYNAAGQPVYYYSNGTFYNYTTGTFGGTAYYPNGTGPNGTIPAYTGSFVTGTTIPTASTATAYTSPVYASTGSGNMSGTMIPLYNSAGQQVNTSSATALPAGYYNTSSGQQVYYYGNGTYYDPSTGLYGGSVDNPTGVAGTYYFTGTAPSTAGSGYSVTAPGVPDTGAGGDAAYYWLMLLASGVVLAGGVIYLGRTYWAR